MPRVELGPRGRAGRGLIIANRKPSGAWIVCEMLTPMPSRSCTCAPNGTPLCPLRRVRRAASLIFVTRGCADGCRRQSGDCASTDHSEDPSQRGDWCRCARPAREDVARTCVCVGAQRSRPFRCLGSLLGGARGCAHDAARASRRVSLLHNLRRDCHICAETRRCIRRSARFWSAATPCRRMRRTMPGPATHAACAAPVRCAAPSTTRSTLAAVSIGHPLRPAPHQRTGTARHRRALGWTYLPQHGLDVRAPVPHGLVPAQTSVDRS